MPFKHQSCTIAAAGVGLSAAPSALGDNAWSIVIALSQQLSCRGADQSRYVFLVSVFLLSAPLRSQEDIERHNPQGTHMNMTLVSDT